MTDLPLIVLTLTIWTYWLCVGIMIVRVRKQTRKPAGVVPKQGLERALWLIWVPLIGAWLTLPYLAIAHVHPSLGVPDFARQVPAFAALRWVAAICAALCLALTIECWLRMGKNWRMAVAPGEQPELVTGGLYAHIRHPIYALSIVLMCCSVVVVPTIALLVVAAVHVLLMVLKARNEERFLAGKLGPVYDAYRERTGRFFPRVLARHP